MTKIDKRNLIFLAALLAFTIDAIVNYYFPVPVYVIYLIVLTAVLLIPGVIPIRRYSHFLVICLAFGLPFTINTLRFGFFKEALADSLYLLTFFGAYYLYSSEKKQPVVRSNGKLLSLFLLISLLLFLASFIGFDQNNWGNTINTSSTDIEFKRAYRQGFFRKPHIASYFFMFLAFWSLHLLQLRKAAWWKFVFIGGGLGAIILLTGSRTPIAVTMSAIGLYYFKTKYLRELLVFIVLCLLVVYNIGFLLNLCEGTVFFQYLSIIATVSENFNRLSRVIIWSSWWKEMQTFTVWEILLGRGFYSSILANMENVGYEIWFHNDAMSIIYTYGIFPLILYLWIFFEMFVRHARYIRSNIFVFMAYVSFVLTSLLNGFYYYYTVLLLFLFYHMIQLRMNGDKAG